MSPGWLLAVVVCCAGVAGCRGQGPPGGGEPPTLSDHGPVIRVAKSLPSEFAVVLGTVQYGGDTLYIYRSPNRMEGMGLQFARRYPWLARQAGLDIDWGQPLNSNDAERLTRGVGVLASGALVALGMVIAVLYYAFAEAKIRWRRPPAIRFSRESKSPISAGLHAVPASWVAPKAPDTSGLGGLRGNRDVAAQVAQPLAAGEAFSGAIETVGLDAVLQILALVARTGMLIVRDADHGEVGRIMMADGRPLDVIAGEERGAPALANMLRLSHGYFSFRDLSPVERLRARWLRPEDMMGLLMEAHRMLDETRGAAPVRSP